MTVAPRNEAELEAELARYAAEQARALGLERDQWTEPIRSNESFGAEDRARATVLVSGLTLAHDTLVCAALRGLGYRVAALDAPDRTALHFGKEFGNRGQCNPTYFTVGNLVKHLVGLRDVQKIPTERILEEFVFVTAGACGPCRFGMYVTEYRKALREAGFEGFRVLLFQQQGGLKQATGADVGLVVDRRFVFGIVRAILAGDVLNLVGYRIRPYEIEAGATDDALRECRAILSERFEHGGSIVAALRRCRRRLARVAVDRSRPKPVVSIIGEFWAMTTEGDGNHELQRFLESEGAEVDVQGVVNWLLFMIWEQRHDTRTRRKLARADGGRKGLAGKSAARKLLRLRVAEAAVRGCFRAYAWAVGLHRYRLPDLERIARLARGHYDLDVRGGEGHMEVGKLLHFVEDEVNHMTISVKPFGCMPSSGVSDGVQAAVTARHPAAIFLPVETTGDGGVNLYSRVQMMLFRARQDARAEFDAALASAGLDEAAFRERVRGSRRGRSAFWRPKHRRAGLAANLAYALR